MNSEPDEYPSLVLRVDDNGGAWLTVNQAGKFKVRNQDVRVHLQEHPVLIIEHDDDVDVIVLTASSKRAFMAGADIRVASRRTPVDGFIGGMQLPYDRSWSGFLIFTFEPADRYLSHG